MVRTRLPDADLSLGVRHFRQPARTPGMCGSPTPYDNQPTTADRSGDSQELFEVRQGVTHRPLRPNAGFSQHRPVVHMNRRIALRERSSLKHYDKYLSNFGSASNYPETVLLHRTEPVDSEKDP